MFPLPQHSLARKLFLVFPWPAYILTIFLGDENGFFFCRWMFIFGTFLLVTLPFLFITLAFEGNPLGLFQTFLSQLYPPQPFIHFSPYLKPPPQSPHLAQSEGNAHFPSMFPPFCGPFSLNGLFSWWMF